MSKIFEQLDDDSIGFIEEQKIFFVATAGAKGRVNLSPKGLDLLRVVAKNSIIWLNLTGSGNESAAHIAENGRMTLMFSAFEGNPLILRVYGTARVIHNYDDLWNEMLAHFDPQIGARQVFVLDIEMVQASCGFAVPLYQYQSDRNILNKWAEQKGAQGIRQYQREKNQKSLDGYATHIVGNDS